MSTTIGGADLSFFGTDPAEQEKQARKYYGVYTGTVSPEPDPLPLSRVGVLMESFDPLDKLAWCRVAAPMAGRLAGTYFVPDPGDEVLVAFENGDLHAPVIVGSLHNVSHPPPVPYPVAGIRAIRMGGGSQLVFSEHTATVALQAGPTPPVAMPAPAVTTATYSSLTMTPAAVFITSPGPVNIQSAGAIVLQVADNVIIVDQTGVKINAKSVLVNGTAAVGVTAPMVKIN